MRKIVYLLMLLSIYFFNNLTIEALTYGGCEYSEIAKLKSYVSNVNISYDYYILNNRAYFDITLNNIVPGLYFVDSATNQKYSYSDTSDGEITIWGIGVSNGRYMFYSALSECYGVKIGSRYYTLPTYNIYFDDPLCRANKNYSLCQKWANVQYSYDKFSNMINEYNEYKNSSGDNNDEEPVVYKKSYLDMFVEFYVEYYYFLLIGIIVICVTIMIISRRKNRFDL